MKKNENFKIELKIKNMINERGPPSLSELTPIISNIYYRVNSLRLKIVYIWWPPSLSRLAPL